LEAIEEKIRIQFRIQIRYLVLGVGDPDPYQNAILGLLSLIQCCGSGSGAFLTLDPGSGIGFFRIPDE
jgi:hypothetical protein